MRTPNASIPPSLAHPEPPAVPIPSVSLAQGFTRTAFPHAAVQTLPVEALRRTDRDVSTHEGALPCSAQKNEVSGGGFYSGTFPKTISLPPLDSNVNQVVAEKMYFTKEEHTMADHSHPMEGAILDFSVTRMRLIELFSRDGEICADEQATLDLFDDAKQTVKHLHNLDRAVETYKKQYRHGITRYGRQKWNLAGLEVQPYEPEGAA